MEGRADVAFTKIRVSPWEHSYKREGKAKKEGMVMLQSRELGFTYIFWFDRQSYMHSIYFCMHSNYGMYA